MTTSFEPWPHPTLPAGMNSTPIGLDEVNGIGINQTIYVVQWDDVIVPRPTILTPTDNAGQTVDMRVQRERRKVVIAKDRNRSRAAGFRGVTQ